MITNMFSEFVYTNKLNLNLAKIQQFCYDVKQNDNGTVASNVGGWHSSTLNDNNTQSINDLKKEILNHTKHVSNCIGFNENIKFEFTNMWIIINQKHNFNWPHTHARCVFSGVFYVKVPEKSGNIVFENTHESIEWCFPNHINKNWTEYNSKIYEIYSEENKIIIFSPFSRHCVQQSLSDEDRISIAFNIGIKND